MNYEELLIAMEKAYLEQYSKYAYSFCDGMIYALKIMGKISSSQANDARKKNEELRHKNRFDDNDE